MQRPIGVTILAVLAGVAGLLEIWRTLVFLGAFKWTFVGREVSLSEAQWGPARWAVILAGIWFWVAAGFWKLRASAWSFGTLIAMFTLRRGLVAPAGAEVGPISPRALDAALRRSHGP